MYTLILNYFAEGSIKTEIAEYISPKLALKRVNELRANGFEISKHHFGVYRDLGNGMRKQLVELSEEEIMAA